MHNKHKAPPSLDPTRFVEPSPLLVRLLSWHVAPVSDLFVVWDFLQFLIQWFLDSHDFGLCTPEPLTTPYNTTLASPHLLLALLPLAWLEPGFLNRALLPCHQIVEGG